MAHTTSGDGPGNKYTKEWFLADPRPLAIYGAGAGGYSLCRHLFDLGVGGKIIGFMDSNPAKAGSSVLDLPVDLPDAERFRQAKPLVLLATAIPFHRAGMRRTCQVLGYDWIDGSEVTAGGSTEPVRELILHEPPFSRPHPGAELLIDLVDACNLQCRNCLRMDRSPVNTPRKITRETFERLIDKAVELGIARVGLYNWTEPFLHPDIASFARHAKGRGLRVGLSSNLSLAVMPSLIETLASIDQLLVTVSGFSRETHARNHCGSDIEVVKKHLQAIAAAKRQGVISTQVVVKYLDFGYNRAEADLFRDYAAGLGIDFTILHGTVRHPCNKEYEEEIADLFSRSRDVYPELRRDSLLAMCSYRENNIPVDCDGNVHLCCLKLSVPTFRVGNLLDDDYTRLQLLRQTHPYCALCGMEWLREPVRGDAPCASDGKPAGA